MVTRGSGEIDWYSYDLPSKIDDLSDSSNTLFWYGPVPAYSSARFF
jgi:hypothetical protein